MMLKIFYIFYLWVTRFATTIGAKGPLGVDEAAANGANVVSIIG